MEIISINNPEKWDNIIKSFEQYDVYYLSSYVKAFQLHGDGEPLLFYYNKDNYRAVNVVMKRDIALDKNFKNLLPENTFYDISTPYGYGGWLFEAEIPSDFEHCYCEFCKDLGFISEFIRFHLFSDYKEIFSGNAEKHTKNIVRSLDFSIDEILSDFEHKVRKNLKKGIKSELVCEIDETGDKLNDFLQIYNNTMNRNEANHNYFFSKSFFETINCMNGNYMYFHVLYNEEIISTELVLIGSKYCYSFLGGTNSNYFALRPNDFLKFEIIKWAKLKGLSGFVLGGGYGKDDGIYKYKKSFAPNGITDFFIGKRVFNQEIYNQLLEIRKQSQEIKNMGFFPLYRG